MLIKLFFTPYSNYFSSCFLQQFLLSHNQFLVSSILFFLASSLHISTNTSNLWPMFHFSNVNPVEHSTENWNSTWMWRRIHFISCWKTFCSAVETPFSKHKRSSFSVSSTIWKKMQIPWSMALRIAQQRPRFILFFSFCLCLIHQQGVFWSHPENIFLCCYLSCCSHLLCQSGFASLQWLFAPPWSISPGAC